MAGVLAVIPARFASTRFPGKPLAKIGGKEMVLHVCDRVSRCENVDRFVVATDDQRILDTVLKGGYQAMMTRSDHPSGTDRIQEVAASSDESLILNIQGDEPFINPEVVDQLIGDFQERGQDCSAGTLGCPITHTEDLENPNIVKVVISGSNKALYFSRSRIPYQRNAGKMLVPVYRHIGMYLYRRETLAEFSSLPESALEQTEMLEQLRLLENDREIYVGITGKAPIGIDTPQDLEKAQEYYAQLAKI